MRKKQAVAAILILVALGIIALSSRVEPPAATPASAVEEVSYGEGIYVLPHNNFPNQLAAFVGKHPELRITAMYAASEGAYGHTNRVVVVTEPK